MGLRQLGKSKIMISSIGLGCWQFSKGKTIGGMYWAALDQDIINRIVQVSINHGINWFDTAEVYGFGQSELALSEGLHQAGIKTENAIIATKWMAFARLASSITNSIDQRLAMLQDYPISLYQIHQPMSFSSVESQMNAMATLLDKKKVKTMGVSNFNLELMRRADYALEKHGYALVSNQMRYNLLDRRIEKNGILDYSCERNITIIAYSPLAQGILAGKFHGDPNLVKSRPGLRKYLPDFQKSRLLSTKPLINELQAIGHKYAATPAQIALNWVINFHGENVVAIPGATSVQQAEQNAAVMNFKLTKVELERLDKISQSVATF